MEVKDMIETDAKFLREFEEACPSADEGLLVQNATQRTHTVKVFSAKQIDNVTGEESEVVFEWVNCPVCHELSKNYF
jgi:hypothetical protein